MCKRHNRERESQEYEQAGVVVSQLENKEEYDAQKHGYFHLHDVEEHIDQPVRAHVQPANHLHMFEALFSFEHYSGDNCAGQKTQSDGYHEKQRND